jgi:hypothetical protein
MAVGVGRAGLVKGSGIKKNGGADQAKEKGEAAVERRRGADFRPRHGARVVFFGASWLQVNWTAGRRIALRRKAILGLSA